jgi:hypothetical protein
MSRQSNASVRLWLFAALFAVGALLPAVAARNSGIAGHSLLQSDARATGLLDHAAAPASESLVPAHLRHTSHALPRTSLAATLLRTATIVAPAFSGDLTEREHVAPLGDAPRSSGLSRAPPAA